MIGSIANNRFLQRVNPEITRAVADSGSSLNHSEIQQLARNMVDLGLWGNLKLWVHSGLVKTRTAGADTFVSKAYDISSNDNDAAQATEANQPELISDGIQGATNDRTDLQTSYKPYINVFSFNAWVKAYDTTSQKYVMDTAWFDATQNMFLWMENNGVVSGGVRDVSSVSQAHSASSAYSANTWYMITLAADSSNLKLYINSSQADSVANINVNKASAKNLKIVGGWKGTHNGYPVSFNGVMEDISFFDIGLSSAQVTAIYNATKAKYGY